MYVMYVRLYLMHTKWFACYAELFAHLASPQRKDYMYLSRKITGHVLIPNLATSADQRYEADRIATTSSH